MHSATHKADFSLELEFQKHLSNASCKNLVIDQGRYKNRAIKWKWIEQEYNMQEVSGIALQICGNVL